MTVQLGNAFRSCAHNPRRSIFKPFYPFKGQIRLSHQHMRQLSSQSTGDTTKYDDDYIYRYTNNRYFFNEEAKLEQRYLKFNIPALKKAVVDAVEGATSIVTFGLLGSINRYSKILYLATDNGKEVMARLPYPSIVGNIEQDIESEAATMEFVRSRMGVPVPRVLGWCSRPEDTEVNAAYILTEKVKGEQACKVWDHLTMVEKIPVVDAMVEIHQKMLKFDFPAYGSIYRRGAVKGDHVPIDDEYVIGPSVSLALTDKGRHNFDVFRGPWTSAEDYVQSLIDVEKQWIKKHADPGTFCGPKYLLPYLQNPSAHLDLLDKVGTLIPLTTFPNASALRKPVLWHPRFGVGDIMISEEDLDGESTPLVSLTHWQHSIVGPHYLQVSPPDLFANQKQWYPRLINEGEMIKTYYNEKVEELENSTNTDLCQILRKVHNGCFKLWGENFMEVRKALVDLENVWHKSQGESFPFPTSEDDKKHFQKEYKGWKAAFDSYSGLCDEIGVDMDGRTSCSDFVFTCYHYMSKKAEWIKAGKAESDWPFEGPSIQTSDDETIAKMEQEMLETARKGE